MTRQEFKAIKEVMESFLDSRSTEKKEHSDCEFKITYDDANGRWTQFHHLDVNRRVIDHEDNPDVIPEGWIGIVENDSHFHLINLSKVESFEIWEN